MERHTQAFLWLRDEDALAADAAAHALGEHSLGRCAGTLDALALSAFDRVDRQAAFFLVPTDSASVASERDQRALETLLVPAPGACLESIRADVSAALLEVGDRMPVARALLECLTTRLPITTVARHHELSAATLRGQLHRPTATIRDCLAPLTENLRESWPERDWDRAARALLLPALDELDALDHRGLAALFRGESLFVDRRNGAPLRASYALWLLDHADEARCLLSSAATSDLAALATLEHSLDAGVVTRLTPTIEALVAQVADQVARERTA